MSGSGRARTAARRRAVARREARTPVPALPAESPWAALDRRRRRPRRLPVLVLALAAAAVLLTGVTVGTGTPLVSHDGVVSVADDDRGSAGDDGGSGDQQDGGSGDQQDGGSGARQDDNERDGDQQGGGRGGGQGGQDDEFPGRDQIGRAGADEYVDIQDVPSVGNRGDGGEFSGGSYSVRCTLSAHKNSDNPIIAPGKRNGAQHMHDYAGNEGANFASDLDSLAEAGTTCTNGDRSPIFWPVLRDLRGVGPDVGVDGGSLDGNVGSFIDPSSIDITFHGHGTRRAQAMPLNIALTTGSAKAGTDNGQGANAKYTCSGFTDRLTDRYPICPQGSSLMRVFDFPSCWNGQDLDSEDHTSHIVYPRDDGECPDDLIPVPALRITVSYDEMPPGRLFAIDTFPEQRHNPITDHTLLEYLASERRAQEGVECINSTRRCVQGPREDPAASGSTDAADQVPRSQTFAHALATHTNHGAGHHHGATPAGPEAVVAGYPSLPVRGALPGGS